MFIDNDTALGGVAWNISRKGGDDFRLGETGRNVSEEDEFTSE